MMTDYPVIPEVMTLGSLEPEIMDIPEDDHPKQPLIQNGYLDLVQCTRVIVQPHQLPIAIVNETVEDSGSEIDVAMSPVIIDPTENLVIKEEPADVEETLEHPFGDYEVNEEEFEMEDCFGPLNSEDRLQRIVEWYRKHENLRDVRVSLERCDKIWKTLQLIKDAQRMFEQCESYESEMSDIEITDTVGDPSMDKNISDEPEYRYFTKNKRKHYRCCTCDQDFSNRDIFRNHAETQHGCFYEPTQLWVNPSPQKVVEQMQHDEDIDFTLDEVLKIVEEKAKPKVKCILCMNVFSDIAEHLTDFHKVGCLKGIMSQCPKVVEESEDADDKGRKRKRKGIHSSSGKKRLKVQERPLPQPQPQMQAQPQMQTLQPQTSDFKCPICLGTYKSRKSFNHHKKLHRNRGETEENFDLAKYMPQPTPVETNEPTICDCGRSFRNYHTLYLHKVNCRGFSGPPSDSNNDADSGIGISIKIKKNKNDSYEVVQENHNSDVSSNDSGAVMSRNAMQSSSPVKGNCVLKLRVEENDEDIDIEEDSVDIETDFNMTIDTTASSLNGLMSNSSSTEVDEPRPRERMATRKSTVPSLKTLCEQVLANIKQSEEDPRGQFFSCLTCVATFDSTNELVAHAAEFKHQVNHNCTCGKKFKQLKFFNVHIRKCHPFLLRCGYCVIDFDNVESFCLHKCERTTGKTFVEPVVQTCCLYCKELIEIGDPFDQHVREHTKSSTVFHCFKCERRFENQNQRRTHFNKEHGTYPCRYCGMQLQLDDLARHEAYHDGLGNPCHRCRKAFPYKTVLNKHRNIVHSALVQEEVKCVVCEKSMKLKFMRRHMMSHLHTEICQRCNKCFKIGQLADDGGLDGHIAINHSNDYPEITCSTCRGKFMSSFRYEQHFRDGSCRKVAAT